MIKKSFYSNFVNEHPSGNLIQPVYANKLKFPISIQELNAYMSDEDTRKHTCVYVMSKDFFPMPVYYSPVLLYIIPAEWTYVYVDSVSMISLMRTIIECYTNPSICYYNENKELVEKAKKSFEKDIHELQEYSFTKWCDILVKFKNKTHNEKVTLENFIHIMEEVTIKRIRLMEKMILHMFGYENLFNKLCTPFEYPDAKKLKQTDQESITKILCHFFDHKQAYRNERLQTYSSFPKVDIQYFNIKEMQNRLKTLPADQIYKNYMDRETALEYLKFVDANEILK